MPQFPQPAIAIDNFSSTRWAQPKQPAGQWIQTGLANQVTNVGPKTYNLASKTLTTQAKAAGVEECRRNLLQSLKAANAPKQNAYEFTDDLHSIVEPFQRGYVNPVQDYRARVDAITIQQDVDAMFGRTNSPRIKDVDAYVLKMMGYQALHPEQR